MCIYIYAKKKKNANNKYRIRFWINYVVPVAIIFTFDN